MSEFILPDWLEAREYQQQSTRSRSIQRDCGLGGRSKAARTCSVQPNLERVVTGWKAVQAWMNNQGQGILNMATGTGKTITSLVAASELTELQDGRLALIVAAPYQHLVDQWVEEIRNFGVEPSCIGLGSDK